MTQQPQPQPQHPVPRRGRYLGMLWSGVVIMVLAGAALFALWPLRNPLPAPVVELTTPVSMTIPGKAPVLPWPKSGQAAVSVNGLGSLGTSGRTATPVPIASVTKVMTAYVILTEHPLKVGEQGPSLTVSAAQAAAYEQEKQRGESVVEVTTGAVFTERQALQAVLLPSANNMARILAAWDAGSVADFVAKMNETAAKLGMAHSHYTDPAGYAPDTVSTAVDQVILARKAMELPAFAEIAKQRRATLPVAGTVENYNSLVGQDGVVGIKTGSTDQAGGCLMFAAVVKVGSASLTIVGAVLGAPGTGTPAQLDAVFRATRPLVRAVTAALAVHTLIHAGEQVATVRGQLGTGTTIQAAEDLNVVGWPGQVVRISTEVPLLPTRVAGGTELGRVVASTGEAGTAKAAVRTAAPLEPPSTWTRLRHHT